MHTEGFGGETHRHINRTGLLIADLMAHREGWWRDLRANLLIALRGGAVMPPLRRKMGSLVCVILEESCSSKTRRF